MQKNIVRIMNSTILTLTITITITFHFVLI